MYKFLYIFICA